MVIQKDTMVRIGILLLIVGIIVGIRYSGVADYISLDYINQHRDTLSAFIDDHYLLSVVLFILLNTLCVAFALPVSVVFNIAAGYFFGLFLGTLYSNIGAVAGACIAFSACRYLLRDMMMRRYQEQVASFNKRFEKQGVSYLLFLQLLPITPYGLIIIFGALSSMSILIFMTTMFIGITPGALIYAYAGRQLGQVSSTADILSWPVIIALSMLSLLALLPTLIGYIRSQRQPNTDRL